MDEIADGLVLVNGRILTLDPQRPVVDALAVSGGRVTAAGRRADDHDSLLQAERTRGEAALRDARKAGAEAAEKLAAAEKSLADLKEQLATRERQLNESIQSLQRELRQAGETNAEMQRQIRVQRDLVNEIAALKESVRERDEQIGRLRAEIEDLKRRPPK